MKKTNWTLGWIFGLLWFSSCFLIWELYLRGRGFKPSVVDSKYHWAVERSRLKLTSSKRYLALAGSSRVVLAMDLQHIQGRYPNLEVVQLGVHAGRGLDFISELAKDGKFNGVIMADIVESDFTVEQADVAKDFLGILGKSASYLPMFEAVVSREFQSRLTALHLGLNSTYILQDILRWRRFDRVNSLHISTNRSAKVDYYRLNNLEEIRQRKIREFAMPQPPPLSFDEWKKKVQNFKLEIDPFLQRGGKVILVRIPVSGGQWDFEARLYPKELYWDRLEKLLGVPTLHFKDFASTRDFTCPDFLHLNASDKLPYTQALFDLIDEKLTDLKGD